MFDQNLVLEILYQIYNSIQTIRKRFLPIKTPGDFTKNDAGKEKLDSICMQLITIGESIKNLDKVTEFKLLVNYSQIEWKKIKGMRDIITHHYFDINEDAIYSVCKYHLEDLEQTVLLIIKTFED